MSTPKKTTAKRKPAYTHKRPEPIPPGEILKDTLKKCWSLGPSIGAGGFGDIYCAAEVTESESRKKTKQYPFVVKIEPRDNGPLFVEMNFYMRALREEDVSAWKTKQKVSDLSIPRLLGWGSHEVRKIQHRFLVIDRYGSDVWTLFTQNNRQMPHVTAARIADQVLSALEYIHSKSYVHADVKGANLLLSTTDPSRVVLVDFGMVNLISNKADPKRAHNGTPEYVSRDAHTGAMTIRGDLETLCLNIVQWLSGQLPWESRLSDLPALYAEKQKHLADSGTTLLKACFSSKTTSAPGWLADWFRKLSAMDISTTPNYSALRQAVRGSTGFTERGPLEFTKPAPSPTKRTAAATKALKNGANTDDGGEDASPPKRGRPKRGASSEQNGTAATNGRGRKRISESSDDSTIEDSPPAGRKPKRVANRKTPSKASTASWRDGAAISASNITRPGEYQRVPK